MSKLTITEFLEARIAEDEEDARERPIDAHVHQSGCYYYEWSLDANWFCDCDEDGSATKRLLAECAAKRAIIERHRPDRQLENWYWLQRKCAECGGTWHKWLNNDVPTDIGPEQGCHTLRALAAVYADHPDYDPEWVL